MRDNPVKQKLAAGQPSFGTMVFEFFTPGVAQILKVAGSEFILYDQEHSGAGIDEIKRQAAFCRGLGVVPLVRVPTTQYHLISGVLDAGMLGIMVPMVESAQQARDIVSYTRYPNAGGVRGAAFGMAHDDYEPGAAVDKMNTANARTLVIALVETAKGIAAVDEIAAVDGIDVVWLGHFDLTSFMGIPGQFQHKDFLKAVDRLVAAAHKHGKVAGFMAADETWARDYYAKGFRMMAVGPDQALLTQAVGRGIGLLRELAAAPVEKKAAKADKPKAKGKKKDA